jgi:hypothetical protein
VADGRLPVIADLPTRHPGLGFPEYADALADAIRGGDPPQFTIGLYGAWGTGKSSLLMSLEERLGATDAVIPVLFDAWRYERSETIVVPLLHSIYRSVEASGNAPAAERVKRALEALVFSLNFNVLGFGVDTKAFKENWDGQLTPLDEAFGRPFAELRKLPDALAGQRLAVLIDDLDRCSPEKVVAVLEAINLIMDVPGFVFVLALDYDVLVEAIATRYPHVSGHDFIQKIIQIPFQVPPMLADQPSYVSELIPQWAIVEAGLPTDVGDLVNTIARLALQSNPRQVKRFINSLLVINRVMEHRGAAPDVETLAVTIGLQLGWPPAFRVFQRAVFAGDELPDRTLIDFEPADTELTAYTTEFISSREPERLRNALQLTGIVAVEEDVEAPALSGAVRGVSVRGVTGRLREELDHFLQGLWERGFRQSSRSARLYYHPDLPNLRFAVAKQVVRLEHRTGVRWRLTVSFLMSRELREALRVIDRELEGLGKPASHTTLDV